MGFWSNLARRMGVDTLAVHHEGADSPATCYPLKHWAQHGRRSLTTLTFDAPISDALFALGVIRATPGALLALQEAGIAARALVARHARGDWGDVSNEDRSRNDAGVQFCFRLISQYRLSGNGEEVWILTEVNRTLTLLLTPDDYWETM